ncbi:MAG: hypothetical protein WCE63_11365 [Acidobacteriaceae bacterium]
MDLQMPATGGAAEKTSPPGFKKRATKAQRYGADGTGMHRRFKEKEATHDNFILNGWHRLHCRQFQDRFSDSFKTGSPIEMQTAET